MVDGDRKSDDAASGVDKRPIERSSTIVLVRDAQGHQQNNVGADVLMVQRAATMGFAGGSLVFPGGKVDGADIAPPWRDNSATVHPGLSPFPIDEHDVRVAAIRELFEECGILLATLNGALVDQAYLRARVDDVPALRAQINADATLFAPFLQSHGLEPAFEHLTLFARWQTPPMIKRRFDTWFFLAAMPSGQTAIADGGETHSVHWGRPQTFLDRAKDGDCKIIFPTARNLELLALHPTYQIMRNDAQTRTIKTITPTIMQDGGDQYLTIPDDLGYPVTRENLNTATRG